MALGSVFSLFSLFILLLTSSLTDYSSAALSFSSSHSEGKVSLGLYYESLCPYSANFIVNYLADIFHNGLIDVVDLNLVPWGNAKLRSNNSIVCQHGPAECLLNTVEACAINVWPDLNQHFPFINCIESLVYEGKYGQWETCFATLGLDPVPVTDCLISGYGEELELRYAAETNALRPPHRYVPWVVVDGRPLYEDYENFIRYVCQAYKGSAVLEICSKTSLSLKDKIKITASSVCHKEEKTTSAALSTMGSKMHHLALAASK